MYTSSARFQFGLMKELSNCNVSIKADELVAQIKRAEIEFEKENGFKIYVATDFMIKPWIYHKVFSYNGINE